MPNKKLEAHPLSGALGAELTDVELAGELDDATVAAIREALLEHCVIFFREQELSVEQHKRLARKFGDIFIHPNFQGLGPDPEIVELIRNPGDTRTVGDEWHTDTTMMPEPPWARFCTESRCLPLAAIPILPTSILPTRRSPTA